MLNLTGSRPYAGILNKINGVLSVTANTTFTGTVSGIAIGELDDVNLSVDRTLYGLVQWEARTTVINTVVDSINGQIGTVVLTTDDIDDSASAHKFVTDFWYSKGDKYL